MSIYNNLLWPDGLTNPSGIKSRVFCIRKSDITTFPSIKDKPINASEEVTYSDDIELKEGAVVTELYSTQGAGKVEFETSGEKDCRMFVNKGSFSYPDINAEARAWVLKSLNSNYIFIAGHYSAAGKVLYVMLGSRDFDSEITVKGTSGDKPGSAKGVTIEVSAPDSMALPCYAGVLKMADGTFNCGTGVFTPVPITPPATPPES